MKILFQILAFLGAVLCWWIAVWNWFDHNDHATLGCMMLSMLLTGLATVGTYNRRSHL